MIFTFAFLIGFSTTMAEPTLIAIANKSSEISEGKIHPIILAIHPSYLTLLPMYLTIHVSLSFINDEMSIHPNNK